MNQVTAFNPPLVCKLLNGQLIRFARSDMEHWSAICEEIKAPKRARLLAAIEASDDLKPLQKIQAAEDVEDMIVSIDFAVDACRRDPKWIKRHLMLSLVEAGENEDEGNGILRQIPAMTQASIAREIAMLPVVKNNREGTEANPLLAGVEFLASATAPNASDASGTTGESTGAASPDSSGTDTPAHASAA